MSKSYFFYGDGDPRHLHSFPTRRSSDLAMAEQRYGAPYWVIHRGDLQAVLIEAVHDNPSITLRLGDRKSTRLNSSHITISYAVFCLKKKKTQHSSNPITPPIQLSRSLIT